MIEIVPATTEAHLSAVRDLWTRYWDELGFTPCFQGFSEELSRLPGRYAPPSGRLLIALAGETPAGAIALRGLSEADCEAKRLYVAQEFRRRGLGRTLMDRLIEEARACGYSRMVGDTMPVMEKALEMYRQMGFLRIEGYPGSTPGAICIELAL